MAGKSQIFKFTGAPMLPGDYMLNVVRELTVLLMEQAVLTSVTSSSPNQFPNMRRQHR
jgi:hypothetical protein